MAKKYIVDLSKDEKAELVSLTQKGRPGARTVIGARFVWRMEDILDLYAEPYQPAFPVICFDEVR